jgi:hypothetical protein
MASIKLYTKGKTPTIYLRFTNGKMFDLSASTNLYILPQYWDKKNQKIKNVLDVPNRDEINGKLLGLKLHILNQYNIDYTNGGIIDKQWLNKAVSDYFNRPARENTSHLIYLSEYASYWLKNTAPNYKVSANKLMDERTIMHYQSSLNDLKEFEGKTKVKLIDIDGVFLDKFSNFLTSDKNFAPITAKRKISRIKFFCARAEEDNIKVNKNYKSRVFVQKNENEDYKMPYLNEAEIEDVFYFDTDSKTLKTVRDNWIIGLWTGLRISDFLTRLDISNIDGDFIEIRTKKTNTPVAIPLHWQVKAVLDRNNGLPPKVSEPKFNKHIKEIAKKIGIVTPMKGAIRLNGRKKIDIYPKYKLITSHICRRSFCSNLFGKVDDDVIMSIAGWSSKHQMYEYNQRTSRESAMKLKKYWDETRIH